MSLFTGKVIGIYQEKDLRTAIVDVLGAQVRVTLNFIPDARIGNTIIVKSSVAITRVHGKEEQEQKNVFGNPR